MPLFGFLSKTVAILTAAAFFVYAVTPGATLGYLAKLFALDAGVSIVALLAYPHIRGVRKGDPAFVREETVLPILFIIPNATILDDGRLNGFVKVELRDGTTGIGKVMKYQGLVSHAEIQLLEKNMRVEARN